MLLRQMRISAIIFCLLFAALKPVFAQNDSIPYPAVLRDNFNSANGPLAGRLNWSLFQNIPNSGAMSIVSNAAQPTSTVVGSYGGMVWDTTVSSGTEASVRVVQKTGNFVSPTLFIYAKLNKKNYSTATGYRLAYREKSGTDTVEIQKVGSGLTHFSVLSSVAMEINPGDVLTFRALVDNKTMIGYVNGVKVIQAVDASYHPAQSYFALQEILTSPTVFRLDDFSVSSRPLPASVTVVAPNGGEIWPAGTSQNITWTSTSLTTVDLSYKTAPGAAWTTIATGVSASSGTYSWTVPNTATTTAKVRVSSGATVDSSNAAFTITALPSVTVLTPNGGESWQAGTAQNITWTSTSLSTVNLSYKTTPAGAWTTIATGISASSGTYSWTLPNAPTTQARVMINSGATSDSSNADFAITPPASVTVLTPNGGESWQAGTAQNITWASTSLTTVNLSYKTSPGGAWTTIATGVSASSGTYSWAVPNAPTSQARVKIASGATVDSSDADFTIIPIPSITVLTPNGGENWQAGTAQNITWTSTSLATVDLSYKIFPGGAWTTIATGVSASLGTYSWAVPNTPTNRVRVKIASGATVDSSDADFTILPLPSVTVVTPNGGESWQIGTSQNITWSSTSITTVDLSYKTSPGGAWTIIATGVNASLGTYSWAVPNAPTSLARIKIANGATVDSSDADFTIIPIPSVTVLTPNGGESWQIGTSQNITWSSTSITTVDLSYKTSPGGAWTTIATGVSASSGTYSWTIPNAPTTQARVKIASGAIVDSSDADFTITPPPSVTVLTPNGGESWQAGSVQNITWSSTSLTTVDLSHKTSPGGAWTTIATGINAASGTYSWTVPNAPTAQARLKISSGATVDSSDADFTIIPLPSVTVLAPNGGESWQAGTAQNITWNSTALTTVDLSYKTSPGGAWTAIATGVSASSGSYAWTVPNAPTAQARVKIASGATVDSSDANFTITPSPSVTLLTPNGGESWQAGTSQNIAWTSASLTTVDLAYKTSPGGAWTTIATGVSASSGTYLWTIPNAPTTQARVKIASGATIDSSDADFAITPPPSVTVLTPNGGESWQIGSSQNITWTSTSLTTVDLSYKTSPGGAWTTIAAGVSATPGTYSWTVPNAATTEARVRVNSGSTTDSSNADFTITPTQPVTLLSPDGGENWQAGTVHNIMWTANLVNTVDLSYKTTPSGSWTSVATGIPASWGTLAWTVPNFPSSQVRVKVVSSADLSVADSSNADFTISPPPGGGAIAYPAILRDDFNAQDGPVAGRLKWSPIINIPLSGSMRIASNAMEPTASASGNCGGMVWDTLMGGGTEMGMRIVQKTGDFNLSSLFLYAKMSSKDYNTGTGYRLRFWEQSGADLIEIHRVGPGYSNFTVLASINREINVGDTLTFRVLADNKTLVGLVNGVSVIQAVDSTYQPAQWYFAIRGLFDPTNLRVDDFKVSTQQPGGSLNNFLITSTDGGAIGQQNAGSTFNIRITARDANNFLYAGFNGTVNIASTGSLAQGGGTSAQFVNGVLASQAVSISNTGTFVITATKTGGSESGTSNNFLVRTTTTYYSQGNLPANLLTTWNSDRGGTGTTPPNFTNGDIFLVTNGDTVTTTAPWTTSGTGNAVQIENGGVLYATALVKTDNFQITDGGRYIHYVVSSTPNGSSSDIPGTVIRTFTPASTVEIRHWANAGLTPAPLPPNVAWGNLTINILDSIAGPASNHAGWNQQGGLRTINGNFTLLHTGSPDQTTHKFVRLTDTSSTTLNIAGDLVISGNPGEGLNMDCCDGNGIAVAIYIGGSYIQTGGFFEASTGVQTQQDNNNPTMIFSGGNPSVNLTQTAGTLNSADINWQVAAAKRVTFASATGLNVSSARALTVNGSLYFAPGENFIMGAGNFALNAGATLGIGSASGIVAGTTVGNLRVSGTRTFNALANYELATTLAGSSPVTGAGFPSVVNNLIVSNTASSGVALTSPLTVNGNLSVTAGKLVTGSNTVTLGSSGSLTESPGATVRGLIKTTRTVSSTSGVQTFGNLGADITLNGVAPGITTVTRTTGTSSQNSGNSSILRYFDIAPATNSGLNAGVTFHYDRSELNGKVESALSLFNSTDGGTTWTSLGGTVDTVADKITASGINKFARMSAFTPPAASVALTAPAGGEAWYIGTVNRITWSSSLVTTVDLSYRTAPGNPWTVIATGLTASTGGYNWTVPNTSTGSARVRIASSSNPNIADSSHADFFILVPDSIGYPAVVRDDFNAANGPIPGRLKWSTITNIPSSGSFQIVSNGAQPTSTGGIGSYGGLVWDSLMSGGTEVGFRVAQKSGNFNNPLFFIYAKMNSKDYNTATGYRLRYWEYSGTDVLDLNVVGPGYPNFTVLASVNREVNTGDTVKLRVLPDNKTLIVLVNNVKVLQAVDSTYMPSQWYFAVRGILNTVPLILDDFRVSSQPVLGGSAMYAAPPVEPEVPKEISLYQNYPNPFNPTTNIRFGVPSDAHVVLQVYNVLGQHVATLLDEVRNAGFHTVQFDASGMANGVYFYRLSVVPLTPQDPGAANSGDNTPQSYVLTRKLLLMK